MKKTIQIIIILTLVLCSVCTVFGENKSAQDAAENLHNLGLFNGTGVNSDGTPNFSLDRCPTRAEAITMLIALLGKSSEAKEGNWDTPFTDVADWAKPFVGYAYNNGLTAGISSTTYGSDQPITASQYMTFVLSSLGYKNGIDFQWNKAWEFTDYLGITSEQYDADNNTHFTRGDMAIVSDASLGAYYRDNDITLAEALGLSDASEELLLSKKIPIDYFIDDTHCSENIHIKGCSYQEASDGSILFSVEAKVPEGWVVYAFNAPDGDVIFADAFTASGKFETFTVKITKEDLTAILKSNSPLVDFRFCNETNIYFVHVNATDFLNGEGIPTGKAKDIIYTPISGGLSSGTVDIKECYCQQLTNDNIRITVKLKATKGMQVIAYDAPNGLNYKRFYGYTSGNTEIYSFDISNDCIKKISRSPEANIALKLAFNDFDKYLLYIRPSYLLGSDSINKDIPSIPEGTKQNLPFTLNSSRLTSDVSVSGCYWQKLSGDIIRLSVTIKAVPDMKVVTFVPPNRVYNPCVVRTSGNEETINIDMPVEELYSIYSSNDPSFVIMLENSDYDRLLITPVLDNIFNNAKPIGSTKEIRISADSSELVTGKVKVTNCYSQKLDNGEFRVTFSLAAPEGMNVAAFTPPDGDIFKKFVGNTYGVGGTFSFDISGSTLSEASKNDVYHDGIAVSVVFNDNDRFFFYMDIDDIYIKDKKSIPVGTKKSISYTEDASELRTGKVIIHSCYSQKLQDGGTRVTFSLTAPENMYLYAFNAPDGDVYSKRLGTTPDDTFYFDIPKDILDRMNGQELLDGMTEQDIFTVVVAFNDYDRFFFFMNADDLK